MLYTTLAVYSCKEVRRCVGALSHVDRVDNGITLVQPSALRRDAPVSWIVALAEMVASEDSLMIVDTP